ncbi:MAG: porin, partial [Planctomycetia bacterium]|nr:porin [Planctomycetia bacterium]
MKHILASVVLLGGFVGAARADGDQALKTELRMDDDAGSRLWITGKEDLGSGLFAQFYLESRFGGDTG